MKRKKCRFVSSSAVPSSIEIIYQRSSSTMVEKSRIGAKVDEVDARPLSPFRSSQLAVITSLMSEYLTEYSRFPLTACCRNPAAHKRIECNAKRGETNSGKKMCSDCAKWTCRFGIWCSATMLWAGVACVHRADRQAECNTRCGITIMLLSRWLCGLLLRVWLCATSNQN